MDPKQGGGCEIVTWIGLILTWKGIEAGLCLEIDSTMIQCETWQQTQLISLEFPSFLVYLPLASQIHRACSVRIKEIGNRPGTYHGDLHHGLHYIYKYYIYMI
mmetsp:Transcript_15994/g.27571  ORF Transcript_15994/g.27571 Transcript_15994/m.27571 type:complete len:103 (-) Transcript_15994:187-495(-)